MAATGAEIASAYVTLTVKMPGVQGQIDKALGGPGVASVMAKRGNKMGSVLAGAVGGAAAAATAKAISLVTGAIDGAVKRVDTINSFPKIMKNLGYSAEDAQKSIKRISDGLAGLPTTLDGLAGTVQQLAPLTGGLDEATGLSLALNNALLAGGKSTELQTYAMEQYTQQLAIGKVDMAAWRSMVTAMPGQMDQLAVSLLGAGNNSMALYAAMKDGTVSFDQFNGAVMTLNTDGVGAFASFEKQALDSTDGIGTGWANLQTAITRNLANIIQKLKPTIDAFLIGGAAIANALGPALIGVIDVAAAVAGWATANKDWLVPMLGVTGALFAYMKVLGTIRAAKQAYAAMTYGAAAADYASGIAAKAGAAAYAVKNSSMVKLIASLRANEALSMRSKIAIVASTVATNAAAVAQGAWNAVLNANPIGLVLTAATALVGGLVWFFTQTKTGQAIWAEFTRFLGEAWANVSQLFQAVWVSLLKPVFDGIGTVATWLFTNILEPAFLAGRLAFAILGGIFQGVWDSMLKPVFQLLGAILKRVWFTVAKPVFDQIKLGFQVLGLVAQVLWAQHIQPVFSAIGQILQWVWASVISPIVNWIREKWAVLGLATKLMYEQHIRPAWDAVASVISSVWGKVKSVIDTMSKVIKTDPKLAFEAARDAIGKAWAGIQDLAKKPVRFVIEKVINDGLIGAVNKIPGVNLPTLPLPKGFARGGILPGMSRMSDGDDQLIMARRGEGMMVSEALRSSADRSAFLAANAAGRRGVGFASMLQGLARGGLVNPLPLGSYSVSQPYHGGHNGIDLAAASGTKVYAAADGIVGLAGVVPMGGNEVYVQHTNGLGTRYSHLSRFATSPGTQVKAGNVIGYVGSTGMSTGPHLHYMVHNPGGGAGNYGSHVNPAPYLGLAGKDLGEAGGASSILDGLVDFAVSKVKGAFPDGGMWVDLAAGLAQSAAEKMAKAFNPFAGNDGHTMLYDNGGWLQPGRTLVENKSGRPEPILTAAQWDGLLNNRGGGFPDRVTLVDEDGSILTRARVIADAAVDRGYEEQAAAGRSARYV